VDAPLRALLVEESAEDAEAILGAICDLPDPCQHRRVSSPEELREALAAFAPDVVLADHAVPGFGDHEALSIVQAHDPLLPFVYVAGTVGEEVAIEAIRRGAADFVLKENLRRLPSVVGRALESARERRERLRIEAALRESEERFRSIVENSHDWIWEIDRDARLTYCNAAVERMLEHAAVAALAEARKRRVRAMAFGAELRGRAAQRLQLEEELRRAVERGEFELHYQPKVAAETHRLVGAEALLRWRHPERGRVGPAEFMAVLEDSGLIVPVGRWALREALRTALAWREHWPGLRLAVNVSARELQHAGFLEHCSGLLAPFAGESPPLDIEVTESLFMEDINQTIALLEEVRALGCRVAIDDFGTGYSSLNYVARLPADELKIDLSFTRLMTRSPETLALVTHIINLAHSLGLRVVAEGVEDEEQAKLLRLLRCDVLQGFLLGPPLPASEFARRLLGLDEA